MGGVAESQEEEAHHEASFNCQDRCKITVNTSGKGFVDLTRFTIFSTKEKMMNLDKIYFIALIIFLLPLAGYCETGPAVVDVAGGTATNGQATLQVSTGQSGGVGTLSGGNVSLEAGFLYALDASVQSDFSVSPGALNFGTLVSGAPLPPAQSITLTNNGSGQVVFTGNGIEIIGTDTDSFDFVSAPDTSPLPGGATRVVQIQFDPPTVGAKSASVRITTDDPDAPTIDVALNGSRVDPTATPTSTSTSTATQTPTSTPVDTATSTPTATQTSTSTPVDTPIIINTPTMTSTETPLDTATPTPTSTATATETPTVDPSASPTATLTITETPEETATPTITPTPTDTQEPTPTFTPDENEYYVFLTAPAEGSIVSGTEVMVEGRIAEEVSSLVDRMLFQKKVGDGPWTDLTNITEGTNPDSTSPYFVNWNTFDEAEGPMWLRALAITTFGGAEASRQIIVEVEHGQPRSVTTRNEDGNIENQTLLDPDRPAQAHAGDPNTDKGVTADVPVGMVTEEVTLNLELVPVERIEQLQPGDQPGAVIGLRISLSNGQTNLAPPLKLSVSYPDSDNDGLIDTNGVDELTARIAFIDQDGNLDYLANPERDPLNNVISGYTSHLSTFVLIGDVATPTPTATETPVVVETPTPTRTPSISPTATPVPVVSVNISPSQATVRPGQSIKLNVTVTGTENKGLNWWVNNIPSGNESVGVVTEDGWYTPPSGFLPVPNPVTVRAVSVADGGKFAEAGITVVPEIRISPRSAILVAGATQVFNVSADIFEAENFVWQVNGIPGGSTEVGTISSEGLYQSPENIRVLKQVQIEARETVYDEYLGEAGVTLRPLPQLFIMDGMGEIRTRNVPMPTETQ